MRGESRLKNPCQVLGGDAAPGILEIHANVIEPRRSLSTARAPTSIPPTDIA